MSAIHGIGRLWPNFITAREKRFASTAGAAGSSPSPVESERDFGGQIIAVASSVIRQIGISAATTSRTGVFSV
jgi:hypothetical protein